MPACSPRHSEDRVLEEGGGSGRGAHIAMPQVFHMDSGIMPVHLLMPLEYWVISRNHCLLQFMRQCFLTPMLTHVAEGDSPYSQLHFQVLGL